MVPDVGEIDPVRTKLTGRDRMVLSDPVRVWPPNRSPNMFGLNVPAAWPPASGARANGSVPGAGGIAIGGSVVLGGRVVSNGRVGSHGGTGAGGQFGGAATSGHTPPGAPGTSCATPPPAQPRATPKGPFNPLIPAPPPLPPVRTASSNRP